MERKKNESGQDDPIAEMRADFEKKSKSGLCEVNFDDVLRRDTWRIFFEKHAPLSLSRGRYGNEH